MTPETSGLYLSQLLLLAHQISLGFIIVLFLASSTGVEDRNMSTIQLHQSVGAAASAHGLHSLLLFDVKVGMVENIMITKLIYSVCLDRQNGIFVTGCQNTDLV